MCVVLDDDLYSKNVFQSSKFFQSNIAPVKWVRTWNKVNDARNVRDALKCTRQNRLFVFEKNVINEKWLFNDIQQILDFGYLQNKRMQKHSKRMNDILSEKKIVYEK